MQVALICGTAFTSYPPACTRWIRCQNAYHQFSHDTNHLVSINSFLRRVFAWLYCCMIPTYRPNIESEAENGKLRVLYPHPNEQNYNTILIRGIWADPLVSLQRGTRWPSGWRVGYWICRSEVQIPAVTFTQANYALHPFKVDKLVPASAGDQSSYVHLWG